MFQLDARIEDWTNGLRQRVTLHNDDIEELEQHVRDSIAQSMTRGLTGEDSFWVATGRVGEAGLLAHEFDKVNGGLAWAQRLFWMPGGYLLFEVCRLMIQAVGSLGLTFAAALGGNGIVMGWVAAGLTCMGWCVVLRFLYWSGGSRGGANLPGRFLAKSPGRTIGVCVGQASIISQYMNVLLAALIPLACLLAMIAIRRRLSGFSKLER